MATAEPFVKQRIREKGRITFAEYMQVALYGPGGYYTRGEQGAGRDYYTSPLAHPVFGALIALQLEQMWRLLDAPDPFHVLEPGAGDGTLARDVLAFAGHLEPAFAAALRYTAIDRASPAPRDGPSALEWIRSEHIPLRGMIGCILSNELVDALPVHRVAMRRGELREVYVTLDGERLVEVLGEPSTPELAARLALEHARLEEGWEAEVNLQAIAWMDEVARSLGTGYVVTIDYGDLAEDLYSPQRSQGTVVSYYAHAPMIDPYANIGRRDITAHANFTTLKQAGAGAGLQPLGLATQRRFLQNLGIDLFIQTTREQKLGQRELQANLMAQRDLIKPEGLGGFRVLLQSKGAPPKGLAGLGKDAAYIDKLRRRLDSLPLPLLDSNHLDLMSAKYPHLGGDWEALLT